MKNKSFQFTKRSIPNGIAIQVVSPSYQRLFVDSAMAFTESRFQTALIENIHFQKLSLNAPNMQQLFKDWMSAVWNLSRQEKFLPSTIIFETFTGHSLQATLHGETHNRIKHSGVESAADLLVDSCKIRESSQGIGEFEALFEYQTL